MWKVARPLDSYRTSRHPTRAQFVLLFLASLAMLTLLFFALEMLLRFGVL
jgi:hypothetical protein